MQNIPVNVGVRDWIWLNVREYACNLCVAGAKMLVNVAVRD